MATRLKADPSQRWWKQVWPIEGDQPPNFGKVNARFKDYAAAKRQLSMQDLVDAIDALDDELRKSLKAAPSRLRKAPDPKAGDEFAREVLSVRDKLAAARKDALRVGNATQVVYSRDVGKALTARFDTVQGLRLKIASAPVEISLLVAVINEIKAKGGDAFLSRGYNDLVEDTMDAMERDIRKRMDEIFISRKPGDIIKKIVDRNLVDLQKSAMSVPTDVLRKLGVYGEIEKTYAKRMAGKVGKATLSSVSAVGAGAGIVLPGTPALAIVGCVLASAAAARDIADVVLTLEKKAKMLEAYLRPVAANLERAAARANAQEGAAALMNELSGLDVFPTLKKARADFKDIEEGVQIMMHRLAVKQKQTGEAVDLMDRLQKDVQKALADGKPNGAGVPLNPEKKKALLAVHKKSVTAQKDVGKLVDSTADLMARGIKMEKHYDALNKKLKVLKHYEKKVDGVQKFADAVGILKTLGMGIGGVADAATYVECGRVITGAERAVGVGNASAAAMKDIGALIKDKVNG